VYRILPGIPNLVTKCKKLFYNKFNHKANIKMKSDGSCIALSPELTPSIVSRKKGGQSHVHDMHTICTVASEKVHFGMKWYQTVKPVALFIVGYAWLKASVRKKITNILKFYRNLLESFWKHFWAWLCLTNAVKLLWEKCEVGFRVTFFCWKIPILHDP